MATTQTTPPIKAAETHSVEASPEADTPSRSSSTSPVVAAAGSSSTSEGKVAAHADVADAECERRCNDGVMYVICIYAHEYTFKSLDCKSCSPWNEIRSKRLPQSTAASLLSHLARLHHLTSRGKFILLICFDLLLIVSQPRSKAE
jgi:hypothetical protein